MHHGFRAIVVCCIAAFSTAAACHKYVGIKAVGNPLAPTFELERETSCRKAVIEIDQFEPVGPKTYRRRPIWAMEQSASDAVGIHRFTYGAPPSGFRAVDDPEPLIEGRSYHVSLRCGPIFGNGLFRVTQVAGHAELENIDALGDYKLVE
jgi:hypothetical protein